jgi:hypothetical protein
MLTLLRHSSNASFDPVCAPIGGPSLCRLIFADVYKRNHLNAAQVKFEQMLAFSLHQRQTRRNQKKPLCRRKMIISYLRKVEMSY